MKYVKPRNDKLQNIITYASSVSSDGEHVFFPAGKHKRMRLIGLNYKPLVIGTGGMLCKNDIKNIITGIKNSITNEMKLIFDAYKNQNHSVENNSSLWIVPRLLFPEIDGLGRLRYGDVRSSGDSRCPAQFMREYFPKPEYREISGFIYNVYRHGLIHSHWPKRMIIDNKIREWVIILSNDSQIHLEFSDKDKTRLNISAKDFCEDFIKAIEKYINEFDDDNALQVYKLTRKFSITYYKIHEPEKEEDVRKSKSKRKYILDADFNFFK